MCCNTVKEPAVMGDYNGAAGKIIKTLFQCPECVHVNVIGRLVKEQHVGTALQRQREVEPVALSAGENAALLLLVGTGEVEPGSIGS